MRSWPLRHVFTTALAMTLASAVHGAPPPVPPPTGLAAWVDPFIGIDSGGNVFPGPALPFGMVKLGPDTTAENANAGYTSEGEILGFSHVHVSGTGGGPKYGVILMTPTTGERVLAGYGSPRADESASVGHYGVTLTRWGVRADLTATRRAGFHRYVFPAGKPAHLLFDLGHKLTTSFRSESQSYDGGSVRVGSPTRVEGYGRYRGGWNEGAEYAVYFCADLDVPANSFGTWRSGQDAAGSREAADTGREVGAWLDWEASNAERVVQARVGISFVSAEKACGTLAAEIPGWSFDAVRDAAVLEWNEVLGRLQVQGGTDVDRRVFYSALWRAHLMPTDRTGENPKWSSKEPYYDDYYAIWDTFRTLNPFLTLVQTRRQIDIVRSLVDIYRHEGWLPDARSGDDNGRTQGGSNAEVLIADAMAKGLQGIDYETAFAGMLKDAEVSPSDARKEGRGGLQDWKRLGYVSTLYERAGSRTMEYALDDWALSEVARRLKSEEDAAQYRVRATNWQNLWNPALSDRGVVGFIAPRRPGGSWVTPFDVTKGGSWTDFFYESNSWEYSLFVPHDVRRLVAQCRGPAAFVQRLDTLFDAGFFNVGNEPGFFAPVLYLWVDRPDRTAERVRATLAKHFGPGRQGLPGNDDSGTMSAFYLFHALGFYPNPGSDVYLISGAPVFDRSELRMENGRSIVVERRGQGAYVRAASLNGKPLPRAWFRHADVAKGATLLLEMGETPGDWGHGNPPPSLSDPQ